MGIRGGHFPLLSGHRDGYGRGAASASARQEHSSLVPTPILHQYETGMYLASSLKAFLITLALKLNHSADMGQKFGA